MSDEDESSLFGLEGGEDRMSMDVKRQIQRRQRGLLDSDSDCKVDTGVRRRKRKREREKRLGVYRFLF